MKVTPIFASDTTGAVIFLILLPLAVLGLIAMLAVSLNARLGRRSWWGFITGLIPTVGGGLFLLMFPLTAGGVPVFFYIAAGVPFVFGLCSLYLWRRGRRV